MNQQEFSACDCGAGLGVGSHSTICSIHPKVKQCTCAGGPFPVNNMHFPYCALQGTIPQPPEDPLVTALHVHIKDIAARPLEMRTLIELERTCLLARELMAVGKMPNAMARRHMIHSPNMAYGFGGEFGEPMAMPIPMGGTQGFSAGQALSSPNETFGVTAIRELVAGLAGLNQKPDESSVIKEMKETIARLEGHIKDALKTAPVIETNGAAS
jgi:hypothetical protein